MINPLLSSTNPAIDKLPFEYLARISGEPFSCDIAILIAEKGNVERTIQEWQAVQTGKGGKIGIAIIILQVIASDEYPEQTFGPLTYHSAFQIVEQVELNHGENGTKKSARVVTRWLLDVIKSTSLPGIVTAHIMENPAIVPTTTADDLGKNLVKYQLNAKCYECDADVPTIQAPLPTFTEVDNSVVISCAEPTATIYFTTDDSYPIPPNDLLKTTSQEYSGPVPIPADGMILRASAYAPGMIGSVPNRVQATQS